MHVNGHPWRQDHALARLLPWAERFTVFELAPALHLDGAWPDGAIYVVEDPDPGGPLVVIGTGAWADGDLALEAVLARQDWYSAPVTGEQVRELLMAAAKPYRAPDWWRGVTRS